MATVEVGTGGYLAQLLGVGPVPGACRGASALATPRATWTRWTWPRRSASTSGAEIGVAVVARESGDDMRAEVGLDIEGRVERASHVIFRGGEIGRRRSANAGAAELWRRLGD